LEISLRVLSGIPVILSIPVELYVKRAGSVAQRSLTHHI